MTTEKSLKIFHKILFVKYVTIIHIKNSITKNIFLPKNTKIMKCYKILQKCRKNRKKTYL